MSEAPERIWAWQGTDPLTDKKWNLGEWYTEDVGLDGDEIEYIRADIHDARVKELEEELKDQTNIFYAWFDTQELAHEAIDKAVLDAAKGYLRTCRVGGMCEWESGCIEAVFADMANLSVFANLFARTKMPLPSAPKQRKENKT
jgi:hypothetical protein